MPKSPFRRWKLTPAGLPLRQCPDVVADDDGRIAATDPAIHGVVKIGGGKLVQGDPRKLAAAPGSLVAAGRRTGFRRAFIGIERRHVADWRDIGGKGAGPAHTN